MIKKIIIGVVPIGVILATWLFWVVSKDDSHSFEEQEVEIKQDTFIKEESENQAKDFVIAEGEIKMASLIDDGDEIIYYNKNNFLKTDLDGYYKKNITSHPFKNVKTIKCSKTGKICLVWDDRFYVYNLGTKKAEELSENIKNVEFNFQEDGLVYLFEKNNKYEISFSGLLGENWFKIGEVEGEKLNVLANPAENSFVYFSRDVNQEKSGIFWGELIGNKNFEKIVEKDVLDAQWSPSGNRVLFSFYDHSVTPKRVQLGFYDFVQGEEFLLGLPTISQKCAWGSDSLSLYCAALTNLAQKQFVLDDWYSREFVSQDVFWKIDLLNSTKERLFNDKENYLTVDSFNLFVYGKYLFFIDKVSGSLIKREL